MNYLDLKKHSDEQKKQLRAQDKVLCAKTSLSLQALEHSSSYMSSKPGTLISLEPSLARTTVMDALKPQSRPAAASISILDDLALLDRHQANHSAPSTPRGRQSLDSATSQEVALFAALSLSSSSPLLTDSIETNNSNPITNAMSTTPSNIFQRLANPTNFTGTHKHRIKNDEQLKKKKVESQRHATKLHARR